MVDLTASKENVPRCNPEQHRSLAASPSPQAVATWAAALHPVLLRSTLVWITSLNNLCLNVCHSGTGLGFPRPVGLACYQGMQRLLYLEEQIMGNIDLLKGVPCCLPFISASPFKVKMVPQDKGVVWRVVCGLWGHLFCRPGISSLNMRCYSTICLYSMCRFRLAEEMHLSSAGRDSSPVALT